MRSFLFLLLILLLKESQPIREGMCKGELFKRRAKGSRSINPSDFVAEVIVLNPQQCAFRCQHIDDCVSFSFSFVNGDCQMYNKVINDLTLEEAYGYTFYQKVSEPPRKCDDPHSLTDFAPEYGVFTKNDEGTVATLICEPEFYQTKSGNPTTLKDVFECENGIWVVKTLLMNKCTLNACADRSRLTEVALEHGQYAVNDANTLATLNCDTGYYQFDENGVRAAKDDSFVCENGDWVSQTKLKNMCIIPPVLLIGISFDGGNTIELYETEHPTKNNKVLTTKLAYKRYAHVCGVFYDGTVAIVGGKISDTIYRSDTELYNINIDQLTPGPDMIGPIAFGASAMVDNEMIICGGFDGTESLASCQKLIYSTEYEWKTFSSMKTVRYSHAMVAVNKNLFVIGGFSAGVVTSTVEKYDSTSVSWIEVSPMSTIRVQSAATGMGGFLYVCGGQGVSDGMKSCEKYDTKLDNWSPVADMNTVTIAFNMLAIEGKLYAFTSHSDKIVESYDPDEDKWKVIEPMKKARSYSKAVQLKLV